MSLDLKTMATIPRRKTKVDKSAFSEMFNDDESDIKVSFALLLMKSKQNFHNFDHQYF